MPTTLGDLIQNGTAGAEASGSHGLRVRVVHTQPPATAFVSVRLTDGTNFYTSTGAAGSSTSSVNQGNPGLLADAWPFKLTDGTSVLGTSTDRVYVTGALGFTEAVSVKGQVNVQGNVTASIGSATVVSGSVVGLLVGGLNVAGGNPMPVSMSNVASESTALNYARGEVRYQKRYDLGVAPTSSYVGFAPNGTATGSVGWTIKRTTQDASGNPLAEEWTASAVATWSNRTSETYS